MRKNNNIEEAKKVSFTGRKPAAPEAKAAKKTERDAKRKETCGILKEITWPGLIRAAVLTVYCGIASVAVAGVIYLYQYGISELVTKVL